MSQSVTCGNITMQSCLYATHVWCMHKTDPKQAHIHVLKKKNGSYILSLMKVKSLL